MAHDMLCAVKKLLLPLALPTVPSRAPSIHNGPSPLKNTWVQNLVYTNKQSEHYVFRLKQRSHWIRRRAHIASFLLQHAESCMPQHAANCRNMPQERTANGTSPVGHVINFAKAW